MKLYHRYAWLFFKSSAHRAQSYMGIQTSTVVTLIPVDEEGILSVGPKKARTQGLVELPEPADLSRQNYLCLATAKVVNDIGSYTSPDSEVPTHFLSPI